MFWILWSQTNWVFVFPFSMLEKGSSTINACDFHWAGVQKLRYLLRNAHRIPAFHPIFTPALGASLGFLLGRAASRPLAVPFYESSGFPFSSISFSNWFPFALTFLEIYWTLFFISNIIPHPFLSAVMGLFLFVLLYCYFSGSYTSESIHDFDPEVVIYLP